MIPRPWQVPRFVLFLVMLAVSSGCTEPPKKSLQDTRVPTWQFEDVHWRHVSERGSLAVQAMHVSHTNSETLAADIRFSLSAEIQSMRGNAKTLHFDSQSRVLTVKSPQLVLPRGGVVNAQEGRFEPELNVVRLNGNVELQFQQPSLRIQTPSLVLTSKDLNNAFELKSSEAVGKLELSD